MVRWGRTRRAAAGGCAAATIGLIAGVAAGGPVRRIAVPGAAVAVRVWQEAEAGGAARPYYAVAFDGEHFSEPVAGSYQIKLRHGDFDPLAAAPAPPIEPGFEAAGDTNLYIVQFLTQPLEAYRRAIRAAGGTVYFFLANHCHIVKMDGRTRAAVEAMPFVRWVGPFHPAYRLEAFMLDGAGRGEELFPLQKYNIMVFGSGMDQKTAVARRIEAMGGRVDRVRAGKYLLEATLTPAQLFEVVRWDEVLFVDRWGPYESDMDIARDIGGANFLESTPGGWTGDGVRGEVIDVGFNLAHVDFQSRPLIQHTPVGSDPHGASTSGIIFGDGTGNGQARGMLPDAQGLVASTDFLVGRDRYDLTSELVQAPYFAVFQSASVGSPRTFFYTNISADHDAALFDFDVLHCQSQSNSGDQASRPQAWAKNVVSCGGVKHHDTLSKADDNWDGGASTGPASDGRIKPDLTHFYDRIFTVDCCGSTAYTSSFGGTSGATPIICGHFGLFFDMWADGAFGNLVDPEGTVFDNRPHMTTAKAMMINTAAQYDWTQGGPNSDLTRVRQGWGMPDLQHMYELRFKTFVVDEADLLTNLGSMHYTVAVEPDEPALKATLTYADPPGMPFSSQHRINDLSLKVLSPSGTMYWGNHGLLEGLWSVPGGEPNTIDTVENVFVENPEPGPWTVEVIAAEINEDGHVETPELDADYALVVTGAREMLPPLFIRLLDPVPDLVDGGVPRAFRFEITAGAEELIAGSETLFYRLRPEDEFTAAPLEDQGGGTFLGTVPAAACGDEPEFYASAEGDGGSVVTVPPNAPAGTFGYDIGTLRLAFTDDFQEDRGWTVENENLIDGAWQRAIPAGGGDRGDPPNDFDGSGFCFVTDNEDGNSDVDGGPTRLISPRLDATGLADPFVGYARWFTNDDHDIDRLDVEISNDDGAAWTLIESVPSSAGWQVRSWRIADFVAPNDMIRLRFSATDNPNDSVTEAGVDAVMITSIECEGGLPGDVNGDGVVDFGDLLLILQAWGDCPGCPEDLTGDGRVGFADILVVLSNWT